MNEFKGFTSLEWDQIWNEVDDKEYDSVESKFQKTMTKKHGPGHYYMDDYQYWELKMSLIQRIVNKWIRAKATGVKPKKKKFNHVGCPSYPCCDLNPNGCYNQTKEVEHYGHRD